MGILQTIFGVGVFGVIGFIIYWVGIVLGIGTRVTEDEIDSDPKI